LAVLDYRRLGHLHDEFDYIQGPRMRGEKRRNHRRKTRRVVKRWEERAWRREVEENDE
jgi:hypothetical protein